MSNALDKVGGFDIGMIHGWPVIALLIPRPWAEEGPIEMDLWWWSMRAYLYEKPMPAIEVLAERWQIPVGRALQLVERFEERNQERRMELTDEEKAQLLAWVEEDSKRFLKGSPRLPTPGEE